ncbi:Long chain acyl-CoA synthetase 7, peroxisomal [Smittium mucronatum]|uniref:Long chain acyl-CoA synthetase 7, peroxisomal n=1 Tax=Smittium mucronatum TaxID=133383 RepID=A0A1R0H441_9FUNG|nr:Long chain acyl-CoA synthetase 7, peroxisomal [Smittium mucronatum]
MKSYAVPNSAKPGQSCVLRNVRDKTSLELNYLPHVKTAYDIFWNSAKLAADKPFLGHRPYDPLTKEYGPYQFITYGQAAERISNLGNGLVYINQKSLGLPAGPISRKFPVALYSVNRPEWALAERSCFVQSLYTVSLYDTYGDSAIEFIVNHSETPVIVCSIDKVAKLLSISERIPGVRNIISMDNFEQSKDGSFRPPQYNVDSISILKEWAASKNIGFYDMSEVEKLGAQNPLEHFPPSPSDIYTICYTSGTTGNPKGAISSHASYTFAAKTVALVLDAKEPLVYFSYLPLAHCYDRNVENLVTLVQGSIGYYTGNIITLMEDSRQLEPNMFSGVPRVLNRLYDGFVAASVNAPGKTGEFARKAVAEKIKNLKAGKGFYHEEYDKLIFNKMKAVLSPKIKYMITGSAPLEANVLDFLRIALSCNILEGFGMTESDGIATVQSIGEFTSGNIGVPVPGSEAKLVDVPDMNYLVTDSPDPRGELYIRLPSLFDGYLKDEAKTKECLFADGWFATGDIAKFNPDGTISIIDRKKNIFKLSQGEYVAPEKIENIISKHPLAMQTFIHGNSLRSKLVGVIVPDPETFIPFAKKVLGHKADAPQSLESLAKDPLVNKAVLDEIEKFCADNKLHGFERPKALYLDNNVFDVENNGLLTPTMKLKRANAAIHYAKEIEKIKYINDFGDTNKYLELLHKANIFIKPDEISLFSKNSNISPQAGNDFNSNFPESSSRAHSASNLGDSLKYSPELASYKNRFLIVSNSYMKSADPNIQDRMTFATRQLSDIKQQLLDFDEFPWEPECFHLLGFICYLLGKNEPSLEFLSIGLGICDFYRHSTQDGELDIGDNMDISDLGTSVNSISSQLGSSLNLHGQRPPQTSYTSQISKELSELYNQVKTQHISIVGTEHDFPLLSEDGDSLHPSLITLLKITFDKFDSDKDGVLNLQQLGKFVGFMNTPIPSRITINQLSLINLPKINRDILLSMIAKYDSEPVHSKLNSNSPGPSKSPKRSMTPKKKPYSTSSSTKNLGLSFKGLCLFYLDQSLQDPEETRKDIEKIKLLQ